MCLYVFVIVFLVLSNMIFVSMIEDIVVSGLNKFVIYYVDIEFYLKNVVKYLSVILK